MPDQRMHDLRINSERARSHKSCEVHDLSFIDGERRILDDDGTVEELASSGMGRQRCGSVANQNELRERVQADG